MSKHEINNEQLSEMFKALGNPHRLALFHRLIRCCPPGTTCTSEQAVYASIGELGEGLAIAPSTLSHHLKELNRSGLISMRRHGKQVECWVEPATLEQLSAFFTDSTVVRNKS